MYLMIASPDRANVVAATTERAAARYINEHYSAATWNAILELCTMGFLDDKQVAATYRTIFFSGDFKDIADFSKLCRAAKIPEPFFAEVIKKF